MEFLGHDTTVPETWPSMSWKAMSVPEPEMITKTVPLLLEFVENDGIEGLKSACSSAY